ncbi:peptidylprolyl isomerase [Ignavibacteria bacterium]
MGALTRMRELSPYVLAAFAVIFIGFMVASDSGVDSIIRSGDDPANAAIGEVNGEKILLSDFENRLKEQLEFQRQGKVNADVDEEYLRQGIWEQMLQEVLVRQEAEKAGIAVTDGELQDLLLENTPPELRKDYTDSSGKFYRDVFIRRMTDPDSYGNEIREAIQKKQLPNTVDPDSEVVRFKRGIVRIEDYFRKKKISENLTALVGAAGSIISESYVERKFKTDNSTADVNYIFFDAGLVDNKTVNISDDEISAYYEKYKQYYPQKPSRKIKYVSFAIEPAERDSALLQKKIHQLQDSLAKYPAPAERDSLFELSFLSLGGKTNEFEAVKTLDPDKRALFENSAPRTVIGPVMMANGTFFYRLDSVRTGANELVKARHILINFGTNRDSAKTVAEGLLRRAKKGDDFGKLASEFSQDKGSASRGGEYDFFPRGRMVKEFEEACFNNLPGSIVGPVETQYGYHIIKVEDKNSTEIKYSEIEVNINISKATKKEIQRAAISLKQQVEQGTPIDTLARRLKRSSIETALFDENTPVLGSRALTSFAFENPVGKVSDVKEIKNYGYVVAQVSDTREKGVKPLSDVKEEIKEKLLQIKKVKSLEGKAKDLYAKIQGKDIIARASEIDPSIQIRTAAGVRDNGVAIGIGNDPYFTAAAFLAPAGKIHGPVRGDRGYYIIQVTNRKDADKSKFATESVNIIKQLQQAGKNQAFYQWLEAAKEAADIVDNRDKYFRN